MVDKKRRRDVIKGIGTAGIIGLAGCGGNGNGGGTTAGGNGGGNGNGGMTTTAGGNGGGNGNGGMTTTAGGNGNGNMGRTIKLGLVMGVTGGLKSLGPPIRDAAVLVPKQVNDADTAFSVDQQFEDSGTNPSQGVQGANALINAGYPMICGALSSEVSLQVAQNAAIPNGVAMCSPASTAPDFTTLEDNDLFFRTAATDALQGQVLANIAANRIGASSASTLFLNNTYGQGLSAGFADAFRNQHNGQITAEVSFPKGRSSYTSQLQQALSGNPDTMLIVGYPESGIQIFRDFYSNFNRPDMPILVPDGLQASSLPNDVGRDMTNVSGTAPTGKGPGLETFTQMYQDEYGSDPTESPFTKQAYDAAAALILANAAAGENSGTAVAENIRAVTGEGGTEVTPSNLVEGIEMAAQGQEINYNGAAGKVAFDENGDVTGVSYQYFEYTSDGLEITDTITP